MSTEFIEILDHALERLRGKDSISEILESYADQAEYLAPILNTAEALKSIPPVEMPPDEVMQMDRVEFLAELEILEVPSVSPGLWVRLKEQVMAFTHRLQFDNSNNRKEKKNMSMVLARATFVIALLFGATGGAYAMADNSLPNEPMYGAKLAMEQIQLNMASEPAGIAVLHLVRAQNRFREIFQLAQKGNSPDVGTMTRLETHLNKALQYAAQVQNESELVAILTRARNMVQEQLQTMSQFQLNGDDPEQEGLRLTLRLLYQFQNQVEAGLQNTNAFRLQYKNQNQMGEGVPGSADCPNCPCDGCDPAGAQNQYQNQKQMGEDAPGSADCPNCPCDGCDPDGAQNQNQYQYQNGQQTGNDTSASQSKDSDCPNCPCVDCDGDQDRDRDQDRDQDRDRDQSCDNPQPGQPQPGECPNCPCEDCVPEGDQNQNGGKP